MTAGDWFGAWISGVVPVFFTGAIAYEGTDVTFSEIVAVALTWPISVPTWVAFNLWRLVGRMQ